MHINEAVSYSYVTIPGQAYEIPFSKTLKVHSGAQTTCDTIYTLLRKPILEKQIWRCNEGTVNTTKCNYLHNKLFIFTLEAVYKRDFRPDINQ